MVNPFAGVLFGLKSQASALNLTFCLAFNETAKHGSLGCIEKKLPISHIFPFLRIFNANLPVGD